MGGTDDQQNIVRLTPEEHYVAHQLLVKLYPAHIGLLAAVIKMSGYDNHGKKVPNKLYGWLKTRMYNLRKDIPRSEEVKNKISIGRMGQPPNHIIPHTDDSKRKMSENRKGKGTQPKSEITRRKMSNAAIGRTTSEEHKRAISEAKKGKPWTQARRDAHIKRKQK